MPSKFSAPSPVGRAGLPADFCGAALTFYDVLGINPRANAEAVKRAFRAKIKRYHPDLRGVGASTSHWSALIIAANEILGHPERRAAYDEYLAQLRAPLVRARRQRMMVYAASFAACFSLAVVWGLKFGRPLPTTILSQSVTTFTHVRVDVDAVAGERVHRRDIASEPMVATVFSSRVPEFASTPAHDSENRRTAPQPTPDISPVRMGSVPGSLPAHLPPLPTASSPGDEIDRIVAEVDRLVRRAPNDAHALRLRGKVWARKGDVDRALADFEQASRIDSNDPVLLHDIGLMWQRKKEFDKAIVEFDRAVRMSFSDPGLYADRGAAWFEKGSYDRALADFDRAIKIDPNLVNARIGRAAVFERKGDEVSARADRELVARLEHRALGPQTDATPPGVRDR